MFSILIIDDEEDIRDILKYNLEKDGFSVDVASNGEDGLLKIKTNIPDLLILDVMMPGMDGIEVCEMIRSTPEFAHIIICLLTARNEDYSQIAGLDSGADDYVSKPVKPKVLISRINALLRRKGKIKSEEIPSGNLVIKTMEGTVHLILHELKNHRQSRYMEKLYMYGMRNILRRKLFKIHSILWLPKRCK